MEKKILLFSVLAFSLVFFSSHVLASPTGFVVLTQGKSQIESFFEGGKLKQQTVDEINVQLESAPEQLVSLFGNNRVNLYVALDDGSVMDYYIRTEGEKVVEVLQDSKGDADLEVRLGENTIDRIIESSDPLDVFLKAMNSGEKKYTGLTPEGETKGALVRVISMLADFFKGIIEFISKFLK